MKTFLKSAQNQSLSSEICSGSSHEIGRSLPIVFQRNWPQKFPRNSREIGRFFREFVPENPAKFDLFFRDLPEALHMKQYETCGALAKATLLAPVSFCQNLNIPICNPLSGIGGPARNRHGSNIV